MKIAVDARPLSSPLTGIGRYTSALLENMLPADHQWFLYSDRPLQVDLSGVEGVTVRCGNAAGGTLGSLRWAQWQFSRWASADGVDLFWSPRHHLPLLLSSRIARVVTIHDLVWRRYPQTMQRKNLWLERLLMGPSVRMADKLICVSRFTAGEVVGVWPTAAAACRVIHEAATGVVPAAELPAGLPADYLLFVGTLEPRKNLPLLLRAYAALRRESDTVPSLLIVGARGWGDVELEQAVAALDLSAHVYFTGYVPDPELHAIYAAARALVMPSLYEGFGLPLLEAMQYGVPVIASTAGALPEVVGDAGLLVSPESEQELAVALRRLVTDPDLHAALAEQARTRAAMFSWQRAATETLALFAQALAVHGGNPLASSQLEEDL